MIYCIWFHIKAVAVISVQSLNVECKLGTKGIKNFHQFYRRTFGHLIFPILRKRCDACFYTIFRKHSSNKYVTGSVLKAFSKQLLAPHSIEFFSLAPLKRDNVKEWVDPYLIGCQILSRYYAIRFELGSHRSVFIGLTLPLSDFFSALKCQASLLLGGRRFPITSMRCAVRHSCLTIQKFHLSLSLPWDAFTRSSSLRRARPLLVI